MSTVTQILSLIVPFVVGLIASHVWNLVEKLPLKLDAIPSILKPPAVAIVTWLIGLLANLLQVQLPSDLHVWTQDTVSTLLAAGFAFLIHEIGKRTAAAPAAPAK